MPLVRWPADHPPSVGRLPDGRPPAGWDRRRMYSDPASLPAARRPAPARRQPTSRRVRRAPPRAHRPAGPGAERLPRRPREAALAEARRADARLGAGEAPRCSACRSQSRTTWRRRRASMHGQRRREPAREDCEAVRRLRAAGAVIVGKTNLSELARGSRSRRRRRTASPATRTTRARARAARAAAAPPPSPPACRGGDRHRRRRLDPHPGRRLRALRAQATARSAAARRPTTATGTGSATSARSRAPCDDAALLPTSSAHRAPGGRRTDPPPLRIAVSFKPALPCKLHPEMRAAIERTVALLASSGT